MSRLTDLIAQTKAKDPGLGAELEREFKALANRRAFGLNFERHRPENVELPGRPIRKGDKVRILPPRGETKKGDQRLWKVCNLSGRGAARMAELELIGAAEPETQEVAAADLIVVAEFRDYIYPGLVSTGKVERGGDKPFHTVINGENFHALEALTFTHRGKIDVIYIDPPYNTGAKDWKYNNDYVEGDDLYRHSKWLAFMERRLKIAKELLNPANSCLIVSIDEKEYLRLGLLLEQTFPEAEIQMVSTTINQAGSSRPGSFSRTDEYLYFVKLGTSTILPLPLASEWMSGQGNARRMGLYWNELMRTGPGARREDSPNLFYPIYLSVDSMSFHSVGKVIGKQTDRNSVAHPSGVVVRWPIRADGTEGRWRVSADGVKELIEKGYIRLGRARGEKTTIQYISRGEVAKVEGGIFTILGRRKDGSIEVDDLEHVPTVVPGTQWNIKSHDSSVNGALMLRTLVPTRRFPFPKSLYAVEDSVRFLVTKNKSAIVLDFFSGSGTTAHAVMRLNRQDGGRRQCISITNNEVAADEQKALREDGLRPGDPKWEQWGICDFITKPRIRAAITGETPDGDPIKGDYKFTDEFPMAEGLEENAEFFTLTYETPVSVSHNRAFARIAPLLWMRAGSEGRRIDKEPAKGWEVADTYGLLTNLDRAAPFCAEITAKIAAKSNIRIAYIVTDDERRFQAITRELPHGVEPVRLYESYLTNFRFAMGRS
ncbi:MAG: site-specific DNA-methyltransferase [Parvibaculaceae bacterium]|nr:site-specific DNA-methyltransferase [Parvibaculaceae bacterium]